MLDALLSYAFQGRTIENKRSFLPELFVLYKGTYFSLFHQTLFGASDGL
jgi:hypothetical protein